MNCTYKDSMEFPAPSKDEWVSLSHANQVDMPRLVEQGIAHADKKEGWLGDSVTTACECSM